MNKLTLPFTIKAAIQYLGDHGIDCQASAPPDYTIRAFAALDALDHTTGHAATWSRESAHSIQGGFGLMIVPSPSRMMGNFFICDDPHRAFFTLMRGVYGDSEKPHVKVFAHGEGCEVSPAAIIYNAVIGNNVKVGHNTVIGGPGFGHVLEPDGSRWRVPHIGRVVIGDNVDIGSNTCIDRGCLGDTIIKNGVKIDNLVHIAHNVVIEENAIVVAHAMIAGSARIGPRAWVAPCASVRNQCTVGADATVGLMANVVKDVPVGATVMGNPAK